jgi:N-acyl amino acid synthase of PEP-CTERM/exosortase system
VVRADTPALLDQAYRLRYQVYCVENPFEDPAQQIDGRETDIDDDRSVHSLLIYRRTGVVAGTVRVILPGSGAHRRPLPISRVVDRESAAILARLAPERTGEISRFAVSKDFRRRCGEERYADIGYQGSGQEVLGERRVLPYITFGLLSAVFEICSEYQIDHICAVMEPALIRLLGRVGVRFEPVGGLVQYHGLRQPCVSRLGEIVARARGEDTLLWRYASKRAPQASTLPAIA